MRTILHWLMGVVAAVSLAASAEFSGELGAVVDDSTGMDWPLSAGEILHVRMLDQQFHAFVLNDAREIIEPSLARVILRGEEARNKTNELNLVLRRVGHSLTHPRRFAPPFDYWLIGIVPQEGESSTVLPRQRFRQ